MLIKIEHNQFNLRESTESTYWSKEAEWFFRDHKIPYVITDHKYPSGRVVGDMITWSDEIVVEIPDISLQIMKIYCNIYKMSFSISDGTILVKFKLSL